MIVSPLILLRNPLAYPAGTAPGFDPTHIAAPGTVFSGIASGNGFINILNGQPGTNVGTPAGLIDGRMGPAMNYLNSTDASNFTIAGTATTPTPSTFAAILYITSSNTNVRPVTMDFSGLVCASLVFNGSLTAQFVPSGITGLLNTPYFWACSFVSASVVTTVVVNLLTGQMQSSTVSTIKIASNTTGNVVIGNRQTSSAGNGSVIAAAMTAINFMSEQELRMWAQRPWDFWYPPRSYFLVGKATSGFKAYWANNNYVEGIRAG